MVQRSFAANRPEPHPNKLLKKAAFYESAEIFSSYDFDLFSAVYQQLGGWFQRWGLFNSLLTICSSGLLADCVPCYGMGRLADLGGQWWFSRSGWPSWCGCSGSGQRAVVLFADRYPPKGRPSACNSKSATGSRILTGDQPLVLDGQGGHWASALAEVEIVP